MGAPFTELVKPLEECALLCRGCLADSGEMKNMFEWGLAEDFSKTTFIMVDVSEAISQLLCTACEEKLESCKQFQSQCAQSDKALRRLAKVNKAAVAPQFETEDNATSCIMYNNQLVVMITAADTSQKIYLPCPYECNEKFVKSRDLHHHIVKYHQADKNFTIDLQYYCNYKDCSYHPLSKANKWFSGRKFLNQHFNKVHRNKIFSCNCCKQKFSTSTDFTRHLKTCSMTFTCPICDAKYNNNERLTVHLMRKHPDMHKQYKMERKSSKRKARMENDAKKIKADCDRLKDFICDSPKRSFATQTLNIEENIKNDVSLIPWNSLPSKNDFTEAKTDEISTQTVFEDLLSIKSQTSEDESIFFSETVSLSDIQTQTFPLEFGLSRCNKETITSETQSPDLSIKETQTCFCLYDSPRQNFKLFDSVSSSPSNSKPEGQSGEHCTIKSDVLLSFHSAETQTYFKDEASKDGI